MLDGRDGDAVDVADGTVADTETGEDEQSDVVFLHIGILLTYSGKAVVVNGVERPFNLCPFVRLKGDEGIAALVEFLHHLRPFEDKVLQERHHLVSLLQFRLLVSPLLVQHADAIAECRHHGSEDNNCCYNDNKERAAIQPRAIVELLILLFLFHADLLAIDDIQSFLQG